MKLLQRIQAWSGLLPILGLLGITYWLNQSVEPPPVRSDGKLRHDPDAIMDNFSATKLNPAGTPHFVLSAKQLKHYPDDESTVLDTPRLTSLAKQQRPTHVIARQGKITAQGQDVFFYDDIEVLREADAQHSELRVQTDFLHILPEQDIVKTDHVVTVHNGASTLRSTGLVMDNQRHTLTLLSQVKTEYVPIRP